jgi:hypothetical protein
MKSLYVKKAVIACLIGTLVLNPIYASAALLKIGTKNKEVKTVQLTLRNMGYFTYKDITGYYGKITAKAVKKLQKDNGLAVDGIVGKDTRRVIKKLSSLENDKQENSTTEPSTTEPSTTEPSITEPKLIYGNLDWFKEVRGIWDRGMNATVTDVDTGLSFNVKRTYGTNHADVEPLTRADTNMIKKIWGGFSWERRAVVVKVGRYVLPGSMTAVPHAGLDSKPADIIVSNRSDNYGTGYNLDSVKNNGASGVMDIHFKNSRTHSTNVVQKIHQDMIKKAYTYIKNNR